MKEAPLVFVGFGNSSLLDSSPRTNRRMLWQNSPLHLHPPNLAGAAMQQPIPPIAPALRRSCTRRALWCESSWQDPASIGSTWMVLWNGCEPRHFSPGSRDCHSSNVSSDNSWIGASTAADLRLLRWCDSLLPQCNSGRPTVPAVVDCVRSSKRSSWPCCVSNVFVWSRRGAGSRHGHTKMPLIWQSADARCCVICADAHRHLWMIPFCTFSQSRILCRCCCCSPLYHSCGCFRVRTIRTLRFHSTL
mmetsp:Transcript_14329/g.40778  ORF Transcript_14329/g.40778 Transcript_14329/m.40778 type:complete len:247 (-) Transcript_14329:475-1215(-)